jgi:hypothetical protein
MEREKEYRKQVDANPRRRGPKRKAQIQAQQGVLRKLEAERQAVDHALVEVQREIVKRKLSRRKRTRSRQL